MAKKNDSKVPSGREQRKEQKRLEAERARRQKEKEKRMQNVVSTQNFSPIRDIQNGIIITTDGRFVKLMEFSPINFDLRSDEEQAAIITQFAGVLRSMPQRIQFKVVTKKADTASFIAKVRADMKTEENANCIQLQKEQIDLIENVGAASGVTRRFFVSFEYEEPSGIKKRPTFRAVVSELNRIGSNIRAALKMCGNEQISIDNDDDWTMSALYSIMCRSAAEKYSFTERTVDVISNYANARNLDFSKPLTIPVNDFIAPTVIDPSNSPQYIIVDDLYYTFAYVAAESYPLRAAGGWPQMLINIGEGVDVDIWLHKENPTMIRQKLQHRLRYNKVKMKDTDDTNQDYEELAAAIDAGYYLKSGISSGDDFCYFGTMLTITAHSLAEMKYKFTEIKNYCIRGDLILRQCNFQQLSSFVMTLPLCDYNENLWKKMRRNLLLSQFASAYPFTSFEMSDEDGVLLGTSSQNGSLVFVDSFDTHKYNNANMTVLGPSGTGKTYTIQTIALRLRSKKQQVFIIAPLKGHEYRRACEAVGGQYIKIAPGSGQNINIMEIRKKDDYFSQLVDGDSAEDESILAKKIQQLHAFFTLLIPDIEYEEKQLLDEALVNTYAQFGITNKNKSLNDPANPGKYRRMPILGDLHDQLEKLGEPAARMYNILSRFVSGSAASFNAQTNVNLDNLYIVMDVSALTKEMLPIGMFIALDYVWDKARENRTSRKSIIVDETWKLIGPGSSALAAEFVLEIFKVIRGYGGAAIAATQDVNDFFALENGRFGAGIINNSRIKILLRPEPKEAETLTKILELTGSEVERAKMMERGTALLIANSNHIFIDIKASRGEHDLITTDRRELLQIGRRKMAESKDKGIN